MEAFYILTPHFLEKIKELNENIRGKFIFCFLDNKLHIGLANNNDKFDANMFKPIDEDYEKKKVFNEIKIIIDFIEMLDLDDTLFM